ncbi:MAG: hypothetical protein IPM06_20650 [Rhizobiales bacterium]|nr:hypothetical protein [Hyphomicrobiales bacterium]
MPSKPSADHPTPAPNSSAARLDADGLSILDSQAWRQVSPYAWLYGRWTISCVRLNGKLTFELWRGTVFCARADDAATLRQVAAQGGGVA